MHHIIPRCMGGRNNHENLIALSARQHFVAHLLLAKIYGGKMIYAAKMMSGKRVYTSRKYAWLKKLHAQQLSNDRSGEDHHFFGRHHTVSARIANRKAHLGKKALPETRLRLSAVRQGNQNSKGKNLGNKHACGKQSLETCAKKSLAFSGVLNPNYGKKIPPEIIAKRTASRKRNKEMKEAA